MVTGPVGSLDETLARIEKVRALPGAIGVLSQYTFWSRMTVSTLGETRGETPVCLLFDSW